MHVTTMLSKKYLDMLGAKGGKDWGINEAGMKQMDDNIGHVLKKLEDMGELDNTIVVFTTIIKTLNSEKARTSQEIEDGAGSIIPIGAVAHIFGGSEKESMEIGTGEYNKKVDVKIAEIQKQCDVK